ncbi:MAG: choice-of-anchor V domain-containing protein [Panacibacter sp.]
MLKNTLERMASAIQQKKIMGTLVCFLAVAIWAIISSYANGPAKNGQVVTGAPFNSNQTCIKSGCHGGGVFGGAIATQLIDSATNQAVTAYVPGKAYKLRIAITKTSGAPKYGFQTTAATTAGANVNTWGVAPASTHNKLSKGHNYFEHSKALKSGNILIPWKGPAAGTGSVVFYTAGNLVNGDGSTSGDQPVNTSLTVTQAPPVAGIIAGNNTPAAKPLVANKNSYSLKLYNQEGSMYVMFHNGQRQQKVQLTYTDLQGNTLLNGVTVANEGDNVWPVKGDKVKGIVVVNVITEDGVRTSLKVIVNQ